MSLDFPGRREDMTNRSQENCLINNRREELSFFKPTIDGDGDLSATASLPLSFRVPASDD